MKRDPQAIGRLIAVLFLLLALTLLNALSGDADLAVDLSKPSTIVILKVVQVISATIMFVLPAILIALLLSPAKLGYLGITTLPKPWYFVLAFAVIICGLPLIGAMDELNKHMTLPASLARMEHWMQSSEEKAGKLIGAMLHMGSIGALIGNLFVIAFMAALSEELFFRGLVQNVLKEWVKNKHVAIWSAAFLFSAFHMQFYGFLPRMALGGLLGYLYVWSGSLWVPILAHFTNNAFSVVGAYLIQHEVVSKELDTVGTTREDLVYIIISAVICTGLVFVAFKIRKKPAEIAEVVS